jgi:hypothetical protein
MKKHSFLRLSFILSIIILGTSSCYETPDYSTTPEIAFNSITKFTVADGFSGPTAKRDSVVITIDYKDGDGDLGEPVNGREEPKYTEWGNYELRTFKRLTNGKFEEVILAANSKLFFPELVKNSKKTGRKSVIEGTLDYGVYFPYSKRAQLTVVKFQIRVRDRSLNTSNVIESDTISVPITPQ